MIDMTHGLRVFEGAIDVLPDELQEFLGIKTSKTAPPKVEEKGGDSNQGKILSAVRSRRKGPASEISQAEASGKFRCTDGLEVVERNGFVVVGRANRLHFLDPIPAGIAQEDIDGFIDQAASPWVRIPDKLTIGWKVVKSLDRDVVTLRPFFHAVKAQQDKHPDDNLLAEMHRQMLRVFNLDPISDVPVQEITD